MLSKSELLKTHRTAIPLTKTAIVPPFLKNDVKDKAKQKSRQLKQHAMVLQIKSTTQKKEIAINTYSKTLRDGRLHEQRPSSSSKVSAITDSKGKVVYSGASTALKTLKEFKQERKKLKECIDKKKVKLKNEGIKHHKKKSKSKHRSSSPHSTRSTSTRSPKTSSEIISIDNSLPHRNKSWKSKNSAEHKLDFSRSRQSNKISKLDSPKILQKSPKLSSETISALSSKSKAKNAHSCKSLLIPNIELMKPRSQLKKSVNLPSKSSNLHRNLQLSNFRHDLQLPNLHHNLPLPCNKLFNCRSVLNTSADKDIKLSSETISSLSSKIKAESARSFNSPLIPNIELIRSRPQLQKSVNLPSKSSNLCDLQLSNFLHDRQPLNLSHDPQLPNLLHDLPSPHNMLFNCRSVLNTSADKKIKLSSETISALSSKIKAKSAHSFNSPLIPNIELIKHRSQLQKSVSLPSKSSNLHRNLQLSNFRPGRQSNLSHDPQLPNLHHDQPSPHNKSFNFRSVSNTFSDKDIKHHKRNLESQTSNDDVSKEPETKSFKLAKIDYESCHLSNQNRSLEAIVTLFHQDVREQENSNDIEMIDISVDIDSLSSFSCSMEIDDLSDSQSYVFVVDTNILIHKLGFLDELKDTPLQGCGLPYIYIPWIVIQELDGLKSNNSKIKCQAVKAIKFIFSIFNSEHPRIRGQKYKISKEVTKTFGDTNDDAILSFCSVLAKKTSPNKLGLLSNDINLCNKAMMADINAFTTDTLFTKIKPDFQNFRSKDCSESSLDKDSISVYDGPQNPTTENLAVKSIICEAKLILKEILEPFLDESLQDAYDDMKNMFLTPPPETLLDILTYYEKYWISVFNMMFDKNVKKHFVAVKELFGNKQGFSFNVDDAITALIAIENICRAVAVKKSSIYGRIDRILQLTKDCKALKKVEDDYIPAGDKSQSEIDKNQRDITFCVFNHLWDLINHLCGMIMDFAGVPHDLTYAKPADTPPVSEFQKLLSNILPSIYMLKQGMFKVMGITTACEEDYKRLFKNLIKFVPSLEIQASPPPTEKFTVQCLKMFMKDPDCREKVKIGLNQLLHYQEMLLGVIHHPIWKN